MNSLREFVTTHSRRGDCVCGRCADAAAKPEQPNGHTADMVFFKVAAEGKPDAKALESLVRANVAGDFANVNLFDGNEHNYIEVGAWIGDQGLALTLMGLGSILGLWSLLSPYTMFPGIDAGLAREMAGVGMLSIQANPKETNP